MNASMKSIQWFLSISGAVVVIGTAILISLPGYTIIGAGQSASAMQSAVLSEQVNSGLPIRLAIPRMHVDAAIEYVGLTPTGAMAVPKGPTNAGWFNQGPRPGENGTAVIAGHFGWKDGIPAVFDTLSTLRKGDTVYVTDDRGVVTTFVVRELRMYGEHDDASDVFSSNDGKAHLNLITCEGIWNKAEKSYSKRLVVFTDKE